MTTDPTAPVPPPASKPTRGLPGAAVLKAAITAAADQARQDLEQRRRVRETAKNEEDETKKRHASDADNDTAAKQPPRPAPRMRMHWGQVTAFVAVILMWTFGAYYGFIAVPQLDALGGILALIALVALIVGPFIIVRSDKMWVRLVGVLLAIVGGVILATSWHAFLGVFVSFRALSTLGLAIAIIVTGLVTWWICRVPLQTEAGSHRKTVTVTDAPKPTPPTPAPVPPPASPATPVAVTPASPATPTVVAPKPAPPASRRKSTSRAPRGKSSPPAPTESSTS